MEGATQVIGRDGLVSEVTDRLDGARLVTLIGPGGIGKSTVAAAAAEAVGDRFALGARTVDLARVREPEGVATSLALQLGHASFPDLLASPTDEPVLLVLDGCEHVLDEAAGVVESLLAACRAPTVLATSRAPLDLPGESVVVVGPLGLPGAGTADADAPAVRLFLDRARHAGADLGQETLADLAALCRSLDGVPLAIEIAAARSRVLTPAEIRAHLDDLDVLSRPRFRGSERHRSVRATIEWSHRLLDEEDRRFSDRLAVLTGSFDVDDAHAVASGGGTRAATIDHLDRLVTVSLLGARAHGEATWYRQLDTVRTHARDRLVAAGDWDATWERSVDHAVARAAAVVAEGGRRWDRSVLDGLLSRLEAHMTALRWCVAHDEEPDRALRLLAALWGVVHQGHSDEVAEQAERALARWPDPSAPGWPDAAATAATCRYLRGAPDEAVALAERALPHAEPGTFAPVTLRRVVAQSRLAVGDVAGALDALDAALAATGDHMPALRWELVAFRARLLGDTGRVEEGLAAARVARVEAEAGGSPLNAVWAAAVEGSLLLERDPDAAAATSVETRDRARALGYPGCEWVALHTLAEAALLRGDDGAAAAHLLELVGSLVERGARTELRNALRTSAVLLHRRGRPAWEPLAATAAALPVVSTVVVPGHERLPLPGPSVAPCERRDAVVLVRAELRAVVDSGGGSAPDDGRAVVGDAGARPGGSSSGSTSGPAADSPGTARAARFAPVGDRWELAWAGRTTTVRTSKGMVDLARLLAEPGRDVHCLELTGAAAEQPSTGEVIDARARREYEQRVRDLQAEVDEAEDAHDPVRAERARAELDAIVDHLTAALSRTGRTRRGAGSAERARSAVTQRIRAALGRIGEHHPELARHLEVSVRTGTYCSYRPEQPTTWDLDP